jgi:Fe-S cluster assembly scaffold protein SufB
MAYSTSLPPVQVASGFGSGAALFIYSSADVHTDVDATDYFTNGSALGMKVNDVVIVVKTTATIGATIHVVTAVTAGGAATVSPAILA